MKIRFVICAATLTLVAAACGSDETTGTAAQDASATGSAAAPEPSPTTEGGTPEAGTQTVDEATASGAADESAADAGTTDDIALSVPVLAGPGDVPDLDMVSVHTGETVNFQSLVSGQTPLLLWFWAPH